MQKNDDSGSNDLNCSFCGKSEDEVKKLITASSSVYICDECVQLCTEIIAEEYGPDKEEDIELPKPYQIKESLDDYVIEQDRPKKVLSVAVHNHYKRINTNISMDDVEIQVRNSPAFTDAKHETRSLMFSHQDTKA